MKFAIVIAAVLASALAAPVDEKTAVVNSFRSDISPEGAFESGYETSNGISSSDKGQVKQGVDENKKPLVYIVREGKFAYPDPEGNLHETSWVADENGYRAESADIPVQQA